MPSDGMREQIAFRHISADIFGAACPSCATALARAMPGADTWAMSDYLAEIPKTVRSGAYIVLVVDDAGWPVSPSRIEVARLARTGYSLSETS